jgi:hypothetical protein
LELLVKKSVVVVGPSIRVIKPYAQCEIGIGAPIEDVADDIEDPQNRNIEFIARAATALGRGRTKGSMQRQTTRSVVRGIVKFLPPNLTATAGEEGVRRGSRNTCQD